jgi:YD repeat-containing protein
MPDNPRQLGSFTRKAISRLIHVTAIGAAATATGSVANAQTVIRYTYDRAGRVTTALYDNGTCAIYTYDANGNRTAKIVLAAGSQNTSTWGTGQFGCFTWS